MAGTVYLRTNRFEVKLEGITFKAKDFESLCTMDFLFPNGKVWDHRPIVGLDVMHHPRNPSILLVLLCFGVGCVILKFLSGEALPTAIHEFFSDKRIHFVGFGIPEKNDLFPFEELGLTKSEVDIGYLATKILKDPKYKRWELAALARKVLGIKRMVGLTEASSFERHEQIKCGICQLFITSVIAMGLIGASGKIKMDDSPKKNSFLKNLNLLPLLAEGWFKLPKGKKKYQKTQMKEEHHGIDVHVGEMEDMLGYGILVEGNYKEGPFDNCLVDAKIQEVDLRDDSRHDSLKHNRKRSKGNTGDYISSDDSSKEISSTSKKPLKGILKCPSSNNLLLSNIIPSTPVSPQATSSDQMATRGLLRRANSKGCNVSFKRQ